MTHIKVINNNQVGAKKTINQRITIMINNIVIIMTINE